MERQLAANLVADAVGYSRMMRMGEKGAWMPEGPPELAVEAGVGGSYFTRILRPSFRAPAVVKTILGDRHPLELTAKKLAGDTRLPIAWQEQRARPGIARTTGSVAVRPPPLIDQSRGGLVSPRETDPHSGRRCLANACLAVPPKPA